MAFRINRVRAVVADDAGFSELASALPDGAETCLCCGQRSRDSLARVLIADESDDNPLALYALICSIVHPIDQLLAEWAERSAGYYSGQ